MKVDRLIPLADENNAENKLVNINLDLSDSLEELSSEEEKVSMIDLTLDDKMNNVAEYVNKDELQLQSDSQAQPAIVYENVDTDTLKIIFTPSRRKTQKRILINIEGALTINNVDLLYSKVNVVFDNYDFVEVTMTNVTDIDLTVIQLFHAIRVSYWSQKKYISINAEFSRDDRKLLNTCGFTEFQTQKTDA